MTKPFEPRELRARVRALIDARHRFRERWEAAGRGELPVVEVPLATHDATGRNEAFVTAMYAAIAEHLDDEDFGVDELARALAMSRATLYRRAANALDISPQEAIQRHRLEQAALWLVATDANVSEIAYGVGFKSVPHFGSRFKAHFGETPGGYRAARG